MSVTGKANLDALLKGVPPTTLVVLDFSASWCMPCREVDEFLHRIAPKMPHALFVQVDGNTNVDLVSSHRIISFPTLVLYIDGREVQRYSRFVEADMEEIIRRMADAQ